MGSGVDLLNGSVRSPYVAWSFSNGKLMKGFLFVCFFLQYI